MKAEIVQSFEFHAAHSLPAVSAMHKCTRVHGHTYKIDIHVSGEVGPETGWVMDFYDLEAAFNPLLERLDHKLLNEIAGLENPTAEHIGAWIWSQLKPKLPILSKVVVWETSSARAVFTGEF